MRKLITKFSGLARVTKASVQIELKTGSVGMVDAQFEEQVVGIEDSQAENRIESFVRQTGSLFHRYDNEWEHQIKTGNPDDFIGPQCTHERASAGSFFAVSAIGAGNTNPNTLNNSNYDLAANGTSFQTYQWGSPVGTAATGPGGFKPNTLGGIIRVAGSEVMHYGSASINSSFSYLARQFDVAHPSSPWVGDRVYYGHDYDPYPTLSRAHESVEVLFPPIFINSFMAGSMQIVTDFNTPVIYVPKGNKCGVFMPIILRFLMKKRKQEKMVVITAGTKK